MPLNKGLYIIKKQHFCIKMIPPSQARNTATTLSSLQKRNEEEKEKQKKSHTSL